MNDVVGTLEHLGYRELRPEGSAPKGDSQAGQWAPLSEANGRYGTTDETHIISHKERPTCRLVDPETGQLVATARKSCSIDHNQQERPSQ